jgi:D-alanyl-D-alanine carboxypeptidase
MFNRFAKSTRIVVADATEEARAAGLRQAEPEHFLLALTGCPQVAPVLAGAGLDRDGVRSAIDAQTTEALAGVGVSADDYGLPDPSPVPGQIGLTTGSKLLLERTLKIGMRRGDKRLEPAHLVLGLLEAEVGTVPRALSAAGVDRAALADRVAATL